MINVTPSLIEWCDTDICVGAVISAPRPAPFSSVQTPNVSVTFQFGFYCLYVDMYICRYFPRSWPSITNIWILRHQVIKKKDKQHSVCYRKAPFSSKAFLPGNLLTIGVYYIVRDTIIFFNIFIFLKGRWGAKGWVWCVYDGYYVCRMGQLRECQHQIASLSFFLPSSERGGLYTHVTTLVTIYVCVSLVSGTLLFRGSPFLLSNSFWSWLYITQRTEWVDIQTTHATQAK